MGRWLVTGLRGTLAPKVAAELSRRGAEVVGWNREEVPPDDEALSAAYLRDLDPAGIVHLAMGSESWAAWLAAFAAERGRPFGFTSTVMVFGNGPGGPFRVGDRPLPHEDYGRYKVRCEEAVAAAHHGAVIARIGWQIDADGVGNNMLAQLDDQAAHNDGIVRASRGLVPACSWMPDTAAALVDVLEDGERSGLVHLDSNAADAWTFPEVVRSVAAATGRQWTVEETDDFHQDQRLIGDEQLIAPLSAH